ncbi:HD-GYP domain-containing protein [Caldalkalibacillus mannanilyticus]|uniref:HD-GYP domain-containing protein n=1 Tax=Caldalkalibacillus mannanilyticus TaxID=1418 RepID=UPI00046A1F77|nr:HD-GYP domain-containing protein [Caldalkalibacillus mannanilyticus]
MSLKTTSYHLIDHMLSKDIFSDNGLLLLSQGTKLDAADITMLLNRQIVEIEVYDEVHSVSKKVTTQIKDLWAHNDYELKDHYLYCLDTIKGLFQQSVNDKICPLSDFMETYSPLLERTLEYSFLFHPLHKIKGHDEYTYRHSINVGLLSGVIGKILGLSKNEQYLLGQMGLLHDIGKLRVHDDILNKPGNLSQEEFDAIKLHTVYGYEILKKMEGVSELIYEGALYHHERLDGSGYPYRLKEGEIPFMIQILSVADTYDAICSDRIYKLKSSPYYAANELMQGIYKGNFNPEIVVPFVRYLANSSVGDQALLDNGKSGEIVYIFPEEPHRPLIKVENEYLDLRVERHIQIVDIASSN